MAEAATPSPSLVPCSGWYQEGGVGYWLRTRAEERRVARECLRHIVRSEMRVDERMGERDGMDMVCVCVGVDVSGDRHVTSSDQRAH